MKPPSDYYVILGVTPDAEDIVIRAAYRVLAQKYHPDKMGDDPDAVKKMQAINQAYSVLTNPVLRAEYDRSRRNDGSNNGDKETSQSGQFQGHSNSRTVKWLVSVTTIAFTGALFSYFMRPSTPLGGSERDQSNTGSAMEERAEPSPQRKTAEQKLVDQLSSATTAPTLVPLGEFTVQLYTRDEHYLQVKITLQCGTPTCPMNLREFNPIVRDRIILALGDTSIPDLKTASGKVALAKRLALVVNSIIEPELTAIHVLQNSAALSKDLDRLGRVGAIPGVYGAEVSQNAVTAANQFWKVTENDLPIQKVFFADMVFQ